MTSSSASPQPSSQMLASVNTLRATVDSVGRFTGGDPAAFTRLGLDPAHDQIAVPAHGRVSWERVDQRTLMRIAPAADGSWSIQLLRVRSEGTRRSEFSTAGTDGLAAFARSSDFGEMIKRLTAEYARAAGMSAPMVVLIDPSGAPTFAGGTTQDYRQLAAMETCRRADAPMAIWQAFEERRLIADARWVETVRSDDRFLAIRNLFPPDSDEELAYVTIPLHSNRTVIGVVAGFRPAAVPITPEHVDRWLALAEELSAGIRLSELLRRAHANGAESERSRINDDIHAGIAQSIFALSLEIARASAGTGAPRKTDLLAIQTMADELSIDVRAFLSDGRPGGAAGGLSRQLEELTDGFRAQTGARVVTDHRVDWDDYSDEFADSLVRVISEAFRNISKHSDAANVFLNSWVDADSKAIIIEVTNDGGIEQGHRSPSGGVGLVLIPELLARWNGHADFATVNGATTLTIQVTPEYQSEWAAAQRILKRTDSR